MDAPCKIQGNIHVMLCLIQLLMCPGFWVHIKGTAFLIVNIFKILYNSIKKNYELNIDMGFVQVAQIC